MGFLKKNELENLGFSQIGDNVLISDKCSIYNPSKISIGSNVRIDDFCILSAGENGIKIGNNVHIACYVSLIGKESIDIGNFVGISSKTAVYSSSDDYSGNYLTGPTVDEKFKNVDHRKVKFEEYFKRKDFLLAELSRRNIYLSNRAKFIKLIIDGKLNLRNKPKLEVVDELTKLNFEQIEGSYDYLLNMAIQSMTKERYEALLKEIQENTDESITISKTEPIDMYGTDLKELRKKLVK